MGLAGFKARAEHLVSISETFQALRAFMFHVSFSLGCRIYAFYDVDSFSCSSGCAPLPHFLVTVFGIAYTHIAQTPKHTYSTHIALT